METYQHATFHVLKIDQKFQEKVNWTFLVLHIYYNDKKKIRSSFFPFPDSFSFHCPFNSEKFIKAGEPCYIAYLIYI